MLPNNKIKTDVLIMGAGLAGIMAAISAAETGADVCIASSTKICSGSSFYPGTWGLGLIGPEDEEDEKDLEETILRIGEGMADPKLVHTLVSGIHDGIEYLEQMGVRLKSAEKKGEKEFIPCFDHKNRDWHGVIKESAEEVLTHRLEELGVHMLSDTHIIQCIKSRGKVTGAVAVSKEQGVMLISCKSFIIASGGIGGLFKYRLNTDDVTGIGQYLALRAGAGLVNLEFMQMMPGFIRPAPKTIYNEKVFKYSNFLYWETNTSIFEDWDLKWLKDCMEIRSTHGPFTTRLLSKDIDVKLFSEFLKNPEGVTVTYKESIKENQPEFIRTYFEWLKAEKHLTPDDPIQLGIFAHASNGGIQIDEHASAGIAGLFACGEVTGGMHGADRLGGLSTANGLVFGRIAGREAAVYSQNIGADTAEETELFLKWLPDAGEYLKEIQKMNFENAMIIRRETDAKAELDRLEKIERHIKEGSREFLNGDNLQELIIFSKLQAAVSVSKCLLRAILLRKESRGSHYRMDYPEKERGCSRCIVSVGSDNVKTEWNRVKTFL